MAPTIEELEAMTDAEVRERYNQRAQHVSEGLEWYREELRRRAVDRQTDRLVELTHRLVGLTDQLVKLTWAMAALTAINVVLVVVTVAVAVTD